MDLDPVTIEIIVRTAQTPGREVGVRIAPGATAAELAEAIALHLGDGAGTSTYVPRLGRWLEPAEPVHSLPFVRGEAIYMGDPGRGVPPLGTGSPVPEMELVVEGGPAMGARWPLEGGTLAVGRGRDCEVTVEDAAMSRKHLVVEIGQGIVRASDAGSTNGTFIEGTPLPDGHEWKPGQVLEAGASLLSIRPRQRPSTPVTPSPAGTIAFNRPPRVRTPPPATSFRIPAPPQHLEGPRVPLIAAGVPLLLALVLWRLLPDNPSFLAILALSPLIAVFSYVDDRRRGHRSAGKAESSWRSDLDSVAGELEAARAASARRLRDSAPGAAELERRAISLDPTLWMRRPSDDDFLSIRVGWGDTTWNVDLQREPGGSERLRSIADERLASLLTLPSVPLTLSLPDVAVVGLAGDEPAVQDAARWWVAQIATLHSPADVSIVAVPPAEDAHGWSWMRWLPHARRWSETPVRDRLEAVAATATAAGRGTAPRLSHATVVLIHERARVPRAVVAPLLREGKDAGIYVVWVGSQRSGLPGECRAIVEVDSARGDTVVTYTDGGSREGGAAEGLDEDTARTIVLALAPVVDESAADKTAGPPATLSLFDAIGAPGTAGEIGGRWTDPPPGLRASVGRSADGPFTIDLVSDGPHALIGGTTGSGKSELLQTLVASLAIAYPPSRLNFLLIDYKGGAAFKDCVQLPHTVGSVTDLDGSLARRALISLEAELRRREATLRTAGARDVSELVNTPESPPRLVVMIDEFATLVNELPSFVDGVVDIAQRGRSLGLHLVLATQRPAGVVNDAVRANTNLRIALRMADDPDSFDVIGTDRAARIPRNLMGRAFVKRGHGEVTEIQTAHASAAGGTAEAPVQVWDLNASPPRETTKQGASDATQLEVLVAAARDAGSAYAPPRSPWLPPLPEVVTLSGLGRRPSGAPIGLLDEPHVQRQPPATLDLDAEGGALVYGAGASGKTRLLVTIAASLARAMPPEKLHLYGLDFASGGLRVLSALPQCGDIVPGEDVERVRRLLFMLLREIEARKKTSPPVTDDPRIVVLVDGYAAFASTFDRIDLGELVDLLPRLIADGRALGVHFVITADRSAAVPGSVTSLITKKIVLRLGDADDYAAFGLSARDLRGVALPPGRGFIDGTTFQAAIVSDAELGEIARASSESAAASGELSGRPIRVQALPGSIATSELEASRRPFTAAFALGENEMTAATADLRHGHFLVAGSYRSGRSTALAAIASGIAASTEDARLELLAPRRSSIDVLDLWSSVARGVEACEGAVARLAAESEVPKGPTFVFVDDADELAEGKVSDELGSLVKRGRDGAIRVVAAAESRSLHRTFGGWLLEVRKDGRGLLLAPDLDVDGELLGTRLPRRSITRFPPGRGFLVERGRVELVQVGTP